MAGSRCRDGDVSNLSLSISLFCFVLCWLPSQAGFFTSFQFSNHNRKRLCPFQGCTQESRDGRSLAVISLTDDVLIPESAAAAGGMYYSCPPLKPHRQRRGNGWFPKEISGYCSQKKGWEMLGRKVSYIQAAPCQVCL